MLTPACLPNASPNEVVSDWLRSIPSDSRMLTLDDPLNEEDGDQMLREIIAREDVTKEKANPEDDKADEDEKKPEPEDLENKDEVKCNAEVEENCSKPAPGEASMSINEALPKNWQSSAAVMKVLLSSSLGRCQSMPEVSSVYGRRLSTSARGLLDCLAQLQLIEPAVNPGRDLSKDRISQYEDIMAILHSLWLTEPRDYEGNGAKEGVPEQVTPPRSSSGVGMSSGSGGSGKENGNQRGDETPPNKTHSLHEDEAEATAAEDNAARDKEADKQAKTDTTEESDHIEEQSRDSPKATDNPSSSDKSSANDDSKTPTDNEQEIVEDSSSGTPPTVVRAPLSKRLSQDPDPVWVLHLLKKLEKQFMSHYTDAMTEFKVRWDLDDSVILDTMICELRDEVSQRIQKSVQLEMKKIQSRAGKVGRSPRPPPGANLSRESTMTEKRRRMLKVMKNQSVKTADSVSDGDMTGDFSDQRSDDEYCPCDACVRKKMAARPFKKNSLAADAPVMIEFDLLKILQLKKGPLPIPPVEPQPEKVDGDSEGEEEEEEEKDRSLEVVREEEEEDETKEVIKADVVLKETTPPEVDEEVQEGQAEKKVEAQSDVKERNSVSDEELEEEENKENTNQEEEAGCECHAKSDQEEESKDATTVDEEISAEEEDQNADDDDGDDDGETGEEETGEYEGELAIGEEATEEGSDNTVKEVSMGERETTEHEKSEKKGKEEDKAEDEEASESREEEEESTGDSNTGELPTTEESTPVEEFIEGDASVSAETEDEDEEDADAGDVESTEDAEEEGSNEQREPMSEEENDKGQMCVCMTEREETHTDDSDTDSNRPDNTAADRDQEAREDAVKPELEKAEQNGAEDGSLLHQITRTSVESLPGSMEDVDRESPPNTVGSIEVPKVGGGGGGTGPRRSRSPARVKRRKAKETDKEMEYC
ncbi:unnamed protein product [Ophioblennius macclurei]